MRIEGKHAAVIVYFFSLRCTMVAEKFQQNVAAPQFSMCKSQPLSFTIDHYAGKVTHCLYITLLLINY